MVAGFVLPCLFSSVFYSCQKETTLKPTAEEEIMSTAAHINQPVTRAYRDSFATHYWFVPDAGFIPPVPAPGWFPGGGEGNATHIGKCSAYFNQYATLGATGLTTASAPVTMFFAQELAGYNVPSSVNSIVLDDKGNTIWFHLLYSQTTPVNPIRIDFYGESEIVGGNGKFAGATGHVTLNGYFNPQDQQDAAFWNNGWIKY
jgi:hypothetical protein